MQTRWVGRGLKLDFAIESYILYALQKVLSIELIVTYGSAFSNRSVQNLHLAAFKDLQKQRSVKAAR
jgi:hypothetical protein